jgi:hypothetical protein
MEAERVRKLLKYPQRFGGVDLGVPFSCTDYLFKEN